MHVLLYYVTTKIKYGCQSGRKGVPHDSKSDFPLQIKNLIPGMIGTTRIIKRQVPVVNRNKEYACGFCPKVFTKRCDWRIHKKQQHTYEMKLMVMKKCDSCDELFPNDKQLSKHMKLKVKHIGYFNSSNFQS